MQFPGFDYHSYALLTYLQAVPSEYRLDAPEKPAQAQPARESLFAWMVKAVRNAVQQQGQKDAPQPSVDNIEVLPQGQCLRTSEGVGQECACGDRLDAECARERLKQAV